MPPVLTRAADIFRSKPVLAALLVTTCAGVFEVTPALARLRLFGKRPSHEAVAAAAPLPTASVGESKLGLETTAPPRAPGATVLAPAEAHEAQVLEQAPPVPLL